MLDLQTGAPWSLRRLSHEMDHLFSNIFEDPNFPGFPALAVRGAFPATNVWDSGDSLVVEMELPGFGIEGIEILVTGNELMVTGERKDDVREDVAYHRRERTSGTFSRSLRLPVEVDAEKVSAEMKDGVLTVTLPKAEAAKPRKIDVKVSK